MWIVDIELPRSHPSVLDTMAKKKTFILTMSEADGTK